MPEETSDGLTRRQRRRLRRQQAEGGGSSTTTGSGGSSPTQQALNWATAILGGDFSSNPLYDEVTNDAGYAAETDAMLAALQNELQEDWLGQQRALTDRAEAGGRYGSGLYQAMSAQNMDETQEAYSQAASQARLADIQDRRNRQNAIFAALLGAQTNAAGIPIQHYGIQQQTKVGMANARAAQTSANAAASANRFNQRMATAAAQQDALSDYYNMLAGIGSWGGSQWGMQPGTNIPTMNTGSAALLGAAGGALQGYGMSQNFGGSQATSNVTPTYGITSNNQGFNYGGRLFGA